MTDREKIIRELEAHLILNRETLPAIQAELLKYWIAKLQKEELCVIK